MLAHIARRRWWVVLLSLMAAQDAHAMSSTAEGSRELTFHDAPYWITITIPQSRDRFEFGPEFPAWYRAEPVVARLLFRPPGVGAQPNQAVTIRIIDRGGRFDDAVTFPVNPTVPEFIAEYTAYQARVAPGVESLPGMRHVSKVRIGDRTWFQFTLLINPVNNTYSYLYCTPLDDKRMLVFDWSPPRGTYFFFRSLEKKKWPEIESMVASIRVWKDPD